MARKAKTVAVQEGNEYENLHDKIRLQAYEHYLERMKKNEYGDALNDWLAAEKEYSSIIK